LNKDLEIIIDKLEAFIRKFYKNRILRGSILLILLSSVYFLLITSIEFYARFGSGLRAFLLFSFIFLNIGIFIYYVLIPFLKIYRIGKRLDYYSASKIIAKHFSNVDDKIINVLELAEDEKVSGSSKELILKSIEQKSKELKPVIFSKAVNLRENLKYARYFVPIAVIVLLILFFNPAIISDGATRVIHYDTFYKIEAPYQFNLQNDTLSIEKGKDFEIKLEIEGDELPQRMFVKYGGVKYLMKKEKKRFYSYKLFSVNNNIDFYFTDEEFTSDKYNLKVMPVPTIIDFNIDIIPPAYTGVKAFNLKNIGDLSVPEGSKITWNFKTKFADKLFLAFNDSIKLNPSKNLNGFVFEKQAITDQNYNINISNKFINKKDILKYKLLVIKDLYPEIRLRAIEDSSQVGLFYFSGIISDDYGFKKLRFNYKEKDSDKLYSVDLPVNKQITTQEYFYSFDFNSVDIKTDIEYYFEVFDNDGVNGSKSVKTVKYVFHKLSEKELAEYENDKTKSINSKIEETKKLTKDLQKDLAELQKDLINNKNSEWENTQKLKNIIEKQNQLEKLMDQISKENKEKNKLSDTYDEKSEELQKKQEEIQKLLDEVMDDEMKKLMEELQKLMEEFDEKKLNELSQEYEMSLEDMNKQLDRNLEQLKQLEVEKKLEKTIDDLNKLAGEQKDLSHKTEKKEEGLENLKKQEKEQADKFDELKENYKDLQKKNEKLENPMRIEDFEQELENIKQQFNKTSEEMQKSNSKKASKSQNKNSQQMQELAQKMQSMMQSGQASQQSENEDDLKQILDNLVRFSINQEDLLSETKTIKSRDPRKVEVTNQQNKIFNDFDLIQDSLYSLAKRVPQINSKINKEIVYINKQKEYLIDEMEDNKLAQAKVRQQNIMTSANELALLLDEVLKQLQKQKKQQCSGDNQCQKPGGGKPSLSQMRKQQESLKSQMEGMIKDLKGQKKKPGGQKMNKSIAKMLAQQEMFQDQLSELMRNSNLSPKDAKKLSEINGMIEDMKRDLVNKNITPELLRRQDQIITRLLEAENSEYEREIDKKRKSEQGFDGDRQNPPDMEKYKKSQEGFDEILLYKNLKLNKYYKEKYNEYMLELNKD